MDSVNLQSLDKYFFIGLPYAAIAVLLLGSIYRYLKRPYRFTSLSSQLLEGRSLHRGIRVFHWGLIVLFFGHLIGFLFPDCLVAWNGHKWRLLLIEIGAFGCGIAALYGLILLIIRRISNKRIKTVTSAMDVIVFLSLLIQIISGLWIAYFSRWGSSWFASVITPYLKSIFLLAPDSSAIEAMPLAVKIHIASGFGLIGMIPFSRLVHFLVYPFRYFYRNTQRFIWNKNFRKVRSSTQTLEGAEPKNN